MPPIAQRLREPAAFVLLGYGAISTLFNTITFLFGPGQSSRYGGGPSFSDRAAAEVGSLLSVVVVAALVGAVMLAHLQTQLKNAKIISLMALISLGVADLFGLVALFSAFGSNASTGWDKTQLFFISLAQLAIAGLGSWLVLGYFQQHGPATPAAPAGGFGQQGQQQPQGNQWGQPPAPQQQQQPWQQPQTNAPAQQAWGPPPQQAPQQPQQPQHQAAAPQQPQWGQPQPPQQDADSMMTQAIPTVQPGQQPPQPQQPPQQPEGGLPIGNWTSE